MNFSTLMTQVKANVTNSRFEFLCLEYIIGCVTAMNLEENYDNYYNKCELSSSQETIFSQYVYHCNINSNNFSNVHAQSVSTIIMEVLIVLGQVFLNQNVLNLCATAIITLQTLTLRLQLQ